MTILKDIFETCDPALYRISITETNTHHVAKVAKHSSPHREYSVAIPKEGQVHGSRFGTCTCGYPRKEGCPCDHMVAVVKVGAIPQLTRVTVMPYWYHREQWRLQFPQDHTCLADFNLISIKEKAAKMDNLRYCPHWTIGNKKGRPKKEQRKKGITDHIQNGGKKRKRSRRGIAGHADDDHDLVGTMIDREVDTILEEIATADELKPGHRKPIERDQGIVGAAD